MNATRAVAISAGRYNACARLSNGRVVCWGTSASGEALPPIDLR